MYMTLSGSHSSGEVMEGYPRAYWMSLRVGILSIHTRRAPVLKAEKRWIGVFLCLYSLK